MVQITGLNKIQQALERIAKTYGEGQGEITAEHGYTQRYALPVHEGVGKNFRVGQAKFLEQPAREKQKEIASVIAQVTKQSGDVQQGLLAGALRLQRESQQLVPVDTSALKASAYVGTGKDADKKALEAFNKSENLKRSKKNKT